MNRLGALNQIAVLIEDQLRKLKVCPEEISRLAGLSSS